MLFCTIYTNYNYKMLAGIRKSAILYVKFKRLALKRGLKVFQKAKEGEDKVMIYICFETRELVLMLIMNLGMNL